MSPTDFVFNKDLLYVYDTVTDSVRIFEDLPNSNNEWIEHFTGEHEFKGDGYAHSMSNDANVLFTLSKTLI